MRRSRQRDEEEYARFRAKIEETETGCWQWQGGQRGGREDSGRYSAFWVDGRTEYGHRYSYMVHHGEIPENYEVDHECENRLCVNPEHLRLIPRRQNRRRTSKTKRISWGKGGYSET